MKQINHGELARVGVVVPMAQGLLEAHELAMDHSVAMDAMPSLVTTANGGVPAFLTTYLDPNILRVFVTPNKAAAILGETRKGAWTDLTAMFPVVESTGEVSSYGDYSENGSANANVNWVSRQSYMFQTITQWGEQELDRAGEARINHAQNLNIASAMVLDKFMNNSYFFGISGLQNYGLLNDPSLPASITPGTKAGGGTTWAVGTADEIFKDMQALYAQLVLQTGGLVTRESKMVFATTPAVEANFAKTNTYGINVLDLIKKNFPNLRIETAVQYAITGGNLGQLIAEDIEGEDSGYCSFNEKMRAHPVIPSVSSWKQKKTGGTWGAIVRLPVAIASALGI